MPTDVEIAPAFIATHRIIIQLGTRGANLWCLRRRLSGGGGDRPRRRGLRGGLPALLKWDWGNYRGLRRWLVGDDPYRSDRTSDQTGSGMIRCVIFACRGARPPAFQRSTGRLRLSRTSAGAPAVAVAFRHRKATRSACPAGRVGTLINFYDGDQAARRIATSPCCAGSPMIRCSSAATPSSTARFSFIRLE